MLKQHEKCSECTVRQYVPVSDEVIRWHLRGKDADMKNFVMGIYPMEADETVRVAVIDFDESSWRRDAIPTVRKARELGLSVALEKSRSGNVGHDSSLPPLADVRVVLANRVYIEQKNLAPSVRCKLIALASFHNLEFSKKQRMKYSVYGEPKIISRALNGDQFIQVPRGCLESTLQVLKGERHGLASDWAAGRDHAAVVSVHEDVPSLLVLFVFQVGIIPKTAGGCRAFFARQSNLAKKWVNPLLGG